MGRFKYLTSVRTGTSRRDFLSRSGSAAAAFASAVTLPLSPGVAQAAGSLFQHGVASGDPLADRVILWTRITPQSPRRTVGFRWLVARDARLRDVVQRGDGETSVDNDFTVKVDAVGLSPGSTYYYRFFAENEASPIGRTRTLPVGATSRLRIAVASCSNHAGGPVQRLPPHRRTHRPRFRTALGRLHLRAGSWRTRQLARARTTGRNHHAVRLPHAARAVQARCRPAGGASPASDDLRLGRRRDHQQRVARRRPEPYRGRRRHVARTRGDVPEGLLRVDAGTPGGCDAAAPQRARLPDRRPGRSADARGAPVGTLGAGAGDHTHSGLPRPGIRASRSLR